MNQLIKKYTTALFNLSLKSNKETLINNQLDLISNFFQNSDFNQVVISPIVKKDIKLNFLLETIKYKNVEELIIKFIIILSHNNRLNLLPDISKYFNNLLEHNKNMYIGTLSTNIEMKYEDISILENIIKKNTKLNISLSQSISDYVGFNIFIENLGLQIKFSKNKIRKDLVNFITKSVIKTI